MLVGLCLLSARIDLNSAGFDELRKLPITEQQARDIYEYRLYVSFFRNIFELRQIPSIDHDTLLRLRPLVVVSLFRETDEVSQRRDEIRDLLERLDSNEGASEGMADVWEDFLMTPQNINRMHFDDLISLPNVSPIDAVAVLNRVARGDTLTDMRSLRGTPGISYYGYSNLRNYVYYKEPPVRNRLFVDAKIQYVTRYFEESAQDMYLEPFLRNTYQTSLVKPHRKDLAYWGYFNLEEIDPNIYYKLRMRYGNNFKAGIMHQMGHGETGIQDKSSRELWEDSKYYVGYECSELFNTSRTYVPDFLDNTQLKLYLGHYRATFGEGLVMENTDFYSPRKTGYGFSKRILGITPDLSRTQQYSLRGTALELKNPWFGAAFFLSQDKKDAIVYIDANGDPVQVNGKNKVLSYVTPTIRFDNDTLREAEAYFNTELAAGVPYAIPHINLAPRKDIVDEKLWGTRLQFSPIIGTKLGFTTHTALYDDAHFVMPDWSALRTHIIRDSYYYPKFKMIDTEISSLYSTLTDRYERDYRRVTGFDGHTVIGNVSVQGEYAELTVDGKDFALGDDPKAYLVSAYTQFENLYFLALYRHYDLEFDNPYSNAFAENERFNDTIIEKNVYTLTNPLMADIYNNTSQAQPEKGIYFETRYRFNNYFTVGRSYLDIWERMSDNRRSARFQSELEFRPLFQLALRLRYKNQVNRYDDSADRGVSKTNEYTLSTRTFLSNRNFLEFEYRYNTVYGPPYTSLTNPAQPGNNSHAAAMTLMNGDYICVNYTHIIGPTLKLQGSFVYWHGNNISHWDWEDMEIDFMGEKGLKSWISLQSRISQNMYMSIKYRNKTYQTKELFIRRYNQPITTNNYFERVERSENTIRLSLDYRF